MKFVVFGAGAIGTLFAARLALAGHSVSVVARGARKAQIEKDGLVLRLAGEAVEVEKETASDSVMSAADGPKSNFLSFQGGTLISGNVTIRRADIWLVDQDPSDAFRLAGDTGPQIRAGYMRQPKEGQVVMYVPDNNEKDAAKQQP